MPKIDFSGIPTGSEVDLSVRNSAGNTLVAGRSPAWAEYTPPTEVPDQVNEAADLGIVSRIPFDAIAADIESIEVFSQPSDYGHVSIVDDAVIVNTVDIPETRKVSDEPTVLWNPENPLSKMVTDRVLSTNPITFTLRVKQVGKGAQDTTISARVDAHRTLCGWSCGRGIKLAVDSNDATVLEPGETHADIHISLSASAYELADVVSEVGSWMATGRVDDYIAAQLTPGGGTVLDHAVSYDPTTYFGSQAKPLTPLAAKGVVSALVNDHGFKTVYVYYERGYDYSGEKGVAFPGGDGLLHPHAVLTWGEGPRPILGLMKFNGSIKVHGLVIRGVDFPLGQGVESAAGSNVIIEDCIVLGSVYFYNQDTFGYPARFTVRNSIIPHAFNPDDVKEGSPNSWAGNYRPSCVKPGGGCSGIILQGNFISFGGFAPDFSIDNNVDGYPFIENRSDERWGLEGFAPPGPNLLTHPIYFDSYTRHILLRDNFVFGSGGSLIQLRAGAVMRNCAFTWGNQVFAFGKGVFDNYSDPVYPGYADGHRSLGQDVVVTHAGYHDGPKAGNALSEGVKVSAPLVAFDRFLVLHDLNPNDPADAGRLVSDWNGDVHARRDGLIYVEDEFSEGGIFEHYKGRERQTLAYWGAKTYNPDGVDLSNVNDATIFRWYDAQRGNAPDTTTDIMDIYWWLREHQGPEIKALVRSFIAFMQAPVGIAPTWRTKAAACSFVPDLAEDGCRWDNPNNWGGDLIPGSFAGDTVKLNGHKVFFQDHTLTVADLDLGAGGHLQAVNGRLNVSAGPVCSGGGALTTDESGQIWIKGYQGAAPLAVTVKGGRFANTGTFSGPADIHVDGSTDPHGKAEFLCAYGAAAMTVRSGRKMEIVGGGPRVGFDGTGGEAAVLTVEAGATLRFVAGENGDLATIREFRSGVNGTAAPNVVSSVILEAGSNLEADCTGRGPGTHTFVNVDALSNGATCTAIKVDPNLVASWDTSGTELKLTLAPA